ncbi:hypothetical protein GCM10009678_16900 [Actinomadura kijaniata]|uniref:DUF397 domain-containing protein n=1 Tax=Actinomadura namibiensis TaxID=182080 RepID=A0A7W3LIK6_ACTNM|nr:DUF397 domain-containing protein [Actinomadura namibiensis]MBA8948829.1 hypothetical protein [Actinomadura namibiensis]
MDMRNATWRKSSHSDDLGGNCVELANLGDAVGVRDSKAPDAGHLSVDRASLLALVSRIKA